MSKARAFVIVLLVYGLLLAQDAVGQAAHKAEPTDPAVLHPFELGLTYTYKLAKIANLDSSNFGLQGASLDGVYWFGPRAKKLGLAFDFSGETAAAIQPGVDLNQISLVAGPRYQLWQRRGGTLHPVLYGEALIGIVRGFHSVFLAGTAHTTSANSFALQTGGGLDLPLHHGWGLRLAAIDYELTHLPNHSDTYQGNLRLSGGVTYRF